MGTVVWFEIFECFRKLALVCIPVFFTPPGSATQLIFGLIVCFCTFGVYTAFAPFIEYNSNIFAQLCQVQIFFALLSSVALNFSRADDVDEKSRHMMDVLLTACTFVPMGVSCLLHTPLVRCLEAHERNRLRRKLLMMCSKK